MARELQGVLHEALYLQVQADGQVASLLNQELLAGLSEEEQAEILDALIVLGLEQLQESLKTAGEKRPERIDFAQDQEAVLGIRFLLSEEKEFQLLLNFGPAFPKKWSERSGVLYALDVVNTLRNLD